MDPGSEDEGPVEGDVPLIPIQRGFFELDLPHREHFNQALLLEIYEQVTGTALPAALFRRALSRILVHHDALRMRFEPPAQDRDRWRQVNLGAGKEKDGFVEIDLEGLPEAARSPAIDTAARRLQRSLDLTHGPLTRMAYFRLGDGMAPRLLWILHHLVVDGVSWRVLLEDLESLVRQAARGRALELPRRTASFQRWAEHLQRHAGSPALEAQRDFWRRRLGLPASPLPVDRQELPALQATEAATHVRLDEARTRALLEEVPRAYRTRPNEALLTALALACARWTGSPAPARGSRGPRPRGARRGQPRRIADRRLVHRDLPRDARRGGLDRSGRRRPRAHGRQGAVPRAPGERPGLRPAARGGPSRSARGPGGFQLPRADGPGRGRRAHLPGRR